MAKNFQSNKFLHTKNDFFDIEIEKLYIGRLMYAIYFYNQAIVINS